MGLDFLELLFQIVGRGLCWGLRSITRYKCQLSDSGYEVLGFIFALLLIFVSIFIVGA